MKLYNVLFVFNNLILKAHLFQTVYFNVIGNNASVMPDNGIVRVNIAVVKLYNAAVVLNNGSVISNSADVMTDIGIVGFYRATVIIYFGKSHICNDKRHNQSDIGVFKKSIKRLQKYKYFFIIQTYNIFFLHKTGFYPY
jgi:hypothetical protein